MVHLDTNFLILSLIPGTTQDQRLRGWIASGEKLGVNTIAWTEFLCGPVQGEAIAAASILLPNPEPFLPSDAVRAAELFNLTGRRRGSLIDCMIAAVSIQHNVQLATENASDFRRFEQFGLRLA
jgi:predicted nucleic acid-binding protein